MRKANLGKIKKYKKENEKIEELVRNTRINEIQRIIRL